MLLYDGGSSGKESAASARDAGDVGSILGWEDPLEKEQLVPTPVLLSGESPRAEEPGYSPWGGKESGVTERLAQAVVDATHTQPPGGSDFPLLLG